MKPLLPPPELASELCQLSMPLDAAKLRGLSPKQREAVLGALAGLMLEAAHVAVEEDDDARV